MKNDVYTEEEIKQSGIDALVRYLERIRINPSKQAEDVIDRIKNGSDLRDSDIVILTKLDQNFIDIAVRLDEIKERQNKGRIEKDDVDYLIKIVFGGTNIGKLEQRLRNALYKKAIENNYTYASSHREEFTTEEFNKLEKAAQNKQREL